MTPPYSESAFNPLPTVLWVLAAMLALPELAFVVGGSGFSADSAAGMRVNAVQMTAWIPDIVLTGSVATVHWDQLYRLLSYSFVSASGMGTLFVVAFTLALGKAISGAFSQWALLALFLGSAIGGAAAQTLLAAMPGQPQMALVGGYPAAYGLIGGFTWLLWMRLRATGGNPVRAFTLIGMLALFQISFAVMFRSLPQDMLAEFAGFGTGFLLSFLVAPGGLGRLRHR